MLGKYLKCKNLRQIPSLAAAYADDPFLIECEMFMVLEDHVELSVALKLLLLLLLLLLLVVAVVVVVVVPVPVASRSKA